MLSATPTAGRFEKLILSLTATSDHHIRSYNKFLYQALQGLGFEEPAAETQLAAPVAQRLVRAHSIDREGMRVEDEGKAREFRGKLRPRKSYEVTLEGTSSNVERYAEETASIGSEEGEEERKSERNERNGNDGCDVADSRAKWNGVDGIERQDGSNGEGESEWKDCNGGDERNKRKERNGQSTDRVWASIQSDRKTFRREAERNMGAIWEEITYPVEITEVPGASCDRLRPSKPLRRKLSGVRDETRLAPSASIERLGGNTSPRGDRSWKEAVIRAAPGVENQVRKAAKGTSAVKKPEGIMRGVGATSERPGECPGLRSGESAGFECGRAEEKGRQSAGRGFWKRWFGSTGGTGASSSSQQIEKFGEHRNQIDGKVDGAASLGGEPQWEGVSRRHGSSIDSKDSHRESICLQL